jgi:two-component system nitrogen regulation response regulator NtrX
MHQAGHPKSAQKSDAGVADPAAWQALAGILGPSDRIKEVARQIEHAARTAAGVSVVGEDGTDRELVARAIHALGRPAQAPFITIHCDAISPARIEHDLFGTPSAYPLQPRQKHEYGNGGPPAPDRVASGSILSRARGGTAFFRHIEEMPDRVQARLAQVLRDGEILAAGSERAEALDVWPMTAVSPQFQSEIDEGRVRHALANRFSGTRVFLPPLRDRREDIPALVTHYIERASLAAGLPARAIAQPALALLSALEWNGNTRQLRGLIDTIVTTSSSPDIGLDAVLDQLQLRGGGASRGLSVPVSGTLKQARQQFEREFIAAVLAQHHGRIPDAARSLGIQRTNLYRKMRALRLTRATTRPDLA